MKGVLPRRELMVVVMLGGSAMLEMLVTEMILVDRRYMHMLLQQPLTLLHTFKTAEIMF